MTKSKVFMASAALAGLLAGSSATIQASTHGSLAGSHAQDAGDKKVKEKHSCKGQNSCKGKGFKEMTQKDCDAAKAAQKS